MRMRMKMRRTDSSMRVRTSKFPHGCTHILSGNCTLTDIASPLEYKTWKKNTPFLYDMILRLVLPSSLVG
jgi:hypothetical protein